MNKKIYRNMIAQYKPKTVTGKDGVEWSGGAHCYLPSLKFYGGCYQSGTPTPDSPMDIYSNTGTYVLEADGRYIYLPDLRGIGDYKDEWDYVSGKGLRYIHKIELDGETKKITVANSNGASILLEHPVSKGGHNGVISTHFKPQWNTNHGSIYALNNTTIKLCRELASGNDYINDWNTWLKAQKDAGTPVTIYYAMAEPIPFRERCEGDVYKPLPNESGHIWWGDGYITGVPVEATYITHS